MTCGIEGACCDHACCSLLSLALSSVDVPVSCKSAAGQIYGGRATDEGVVPLTTGQIDGEGS
jgi:hypothetical protein